MTTTRRIIVAVAFGLLVSAWTMGLFWLHGVDLTKRGEGLGLSFLLASATGFIAGSFLFHTSERKSP